MFGASQMLLATGQEGEQDGDYQDSMKWRKIAR